MELPEGAVAEGLERIGQVIAALWRNDDKQGKEKKAERERRREPRKLKKEKEKKGRDSRMHGEDLWCLTTCGS